MTRRGVDQGGQRALLIAKPVVGSHRFVIEPEHVPEWAVGAIGRLGPSRVVRVSRRMALAMASPGQGYSERGGMTKLAIGTAIACKALDESIAVDS